MLETENQSLVGGSNQQNQGSFAEVLDAYQRNSNWWAVAACFELSNMTPTAAWIAKKTGLDVADVEEALEGLRMLGFYRKEGDKFIPVRGKDFVHFDFESRTRAESIDQHALVSQQILNDLGPNRKTAFDHRCFAANDEIIVELYKDIAAAYEKAFAKAKKSEKNDRIFKMTYTAVDVLQGS